MGADVATCAVRQATSVANGTVSNRFNAGDFTIIPFDVPSEFMAPNGQNARCLREFAIIKP